MPSRAELEAAVAAKRRRAELEAAVAAKRASAEGQFSTITEPPKLGIGTSTSESGMMPTAFTEAAEEAWPVVKELGLDVGQGIVAGLGGTLGGIGGAGLGPLGVGAGAVSGASAANTAAGSLRRYFQDKPVTRETVNEDAAEGAIGQALFGSPALKAFGKQILPEVRGLPGKVASGVYDKVYPGVAEILTGVPRGATSTYKKIPKTVDTITDVQVGQVAAKGAKDANTALKTELDLANSEINASLAGVDVVDASQPKALLEDALADLRAKAADRPEAYAAQIRAVEGMLQKYFTKPPIPVKRQQGYEEQLLSVLDPVSAKQMFPEPLVTHMPNPEGHLLTPEQALDFKRLLREESSALFPQFGEDLGRLGAGNSDTAHRALDAAAAIDQSLEAVGGKAFRDANAKYSQLKDLEKTLTPVLKGDPGGAKAAQALANVHNDSLGQQVKRGAIQDLDRRVGSNLSPTADFLEAIKYYKEPSPTPLSRGSSSTTRTILSALGATGIGAAGGMSSENPWTGVLTGGASALATSPWVHKKGMKTLGAFDKLRDPMSVLGRSAWTNMYGDDR